MRHFSYTVRRPEDLTLSAERFRAASPKNYKGLLISVFTTSADRRHVSEISGFLKSAFPDAAIVGCVTTECIKDGGIKASGVVISFDVFEKSVVEAVSFNDPERLSEDGEKFRAKAERTKNLAAVGIIGTFHSVDVQPFLDRLSSIDEKVVFFGGGANTLQDSAAYVFSDEGVIDEGLIAVTATRAYIANITPDGVSYGITDALITGIFSLI